MLIPRDDDITILGWGIPLLLGGGTPEIICAQKCHKAQLRLQTLKVLSGYEGIPDLCQGYKLYTLHFNSL